MLFYKIPTVKVLKGLLTITLSLILFAHLPSLPLENMLYEGLNGDLPSPTSRSHLPHPLPSGQPTSGGWLYLPLTPYLSQLSGYFLQQDF